ALSVSSFCGGTVVHSFPTRRSSDLGHGGRRRRRHRNRDKLTLNRRLGTAFGRTAPLVNQVRVNTVAQRHTGDGSLRGLALLKNRSEEHTSELQSRENLVCRLLLERR